MLYKAATQQRRHGRNPGGDHGILAADHPQTVRQVFYQLVTRGIIEKTEAEYQKRSFACLPRCGLMVRSIGIGSLT